MSKSVDQYYAPDPDQPFPETVGTRWNPSIDGAFGYRDVVAIRKGFQVVVGDVRHEQSTSITANEDGVAKFHFRLSGAGSAALAGGQRVDIQEHCWMLLVHPEQTAKQEWFLAGQHEQSVTLLCGRRFLRQRVGPLSPGLPTMLRAYLDGDTVEPSQSTFPLRADMAQAVSSLLACELTGVLRVLYVEAKATELLTLGVQSLLDAVAGQERRDTGLSADDSAAIFKARGYLERHFLSPPTIADLAIEVGLNEARLMRAFKQCFGATIFEFAQQLRMERAKKLLETTDLTVTTIGMEVGYEYSSNFTTAFKRHFGITPRAARDAANL